MRSDRLQKAIDSQLSSLQVTNDMHDALRERMEKEQNMRVSHKFSVAVVLAIVVALALSVTAVAGGWGAFGRMNYMKEKMDVLDEVSADVNASVTVLGDTFTINQAYYAGSMLFLSETVTRVPEHQGGVWTEPWTYDGRPMNRVLNQWAFDRPGEHGEIIRLLQPGESCTHVLMMLVSDLEMPDGTVLNAEPLSEGETDGGVLDSFVYQVPTGAPDSLTLTTYVYINREYVMCDAQGQYWIDEGPGECMGTLTFTVKRMTTDVDEAVYAGPMLCHWQSGESTSVTIDARLVRCRELNLCSVNVVLSNIEQAKAWHEYLLMDTNDDAPPRPADLIDDFALIADGEELYPIRMTYGFDWDTGLYEACMIFDMDGTSAYQQYQLAPVNRYNRRPTDCTYDLVTLR